jgi:hypothetical protein
MLKTWTKPIIGVTALSVVGVFVLSLDGIAQAKAPLDPQEGHDTFQLVLASTANSDTGVLYVQNTITGDLIEGPLLVDVDLVKDYQPKK